MKVSVIQLQSQTNKSKNIEDALTIAECAINQDKSDLIALPEMFAFNGGSNKDKKNSAENIPNGETCKILSDFAKSKKIYIHGGSFYEKNNNKVFNTTVAFDKQGSIIARYRKIHLFDVTIPNGKNYLESDSVLPGTEIVTYNAGEIVIGCSICYDLRFSELYLALAKKNVDAIMIPASFTRQTGKDHWETLLRARAIESQSYVIAPAQCGEFPDEKGGINKTWGHSMIVDPWGHIVAEVPDGTGWATAKLDKDFLSEVRTNIPVSDHRSL
jgi:nitrilase